MQCMASAWSVWNVAESGICCVGVIAPVCWRARAWVGRRESQKPKRPGRALPLLHPHHILSTLSPLDRSPNREQRSPVSLL